MPDVTNIDSKEITTSESVDKPRVFTATVDNKASSASATSPVALESQVKYERPKDDPDFKSILQKIIDGSAFHQAGRGLVTAELDAENELRRRNPGRYASPSKQRGKPQSLRRA